MRILLSEGSGLTSRQVAGQLGSLGHEVEILSSSKICLTRFTRHVRAVHDVPRFGLDPFGWLAAAERIAGERKIDLLFPTQEQVTVLSARRKHLRVATIVPPFPSLARVQDTRFCGRCLSKSHDSTMAETMVRLDYQSGGLPSDATLRAERLTVPLPNSRNAASSSLSPKERLAGSHHTRANGA
jgi:hypothetical protein